MKLSLITFGVGLAAGYLVKNSKRSSVNHYIKNAVMPEVGSILYCKIYNVEHTGIYIGNGEIVELLGTGEVIKTTFLNFTERTRGAYIYLATDLDGKPVYCKKLAKRAKKMIGQRFKYHFVINNCHKFVAGTILQNYNLNIFNNSFLFLERTIRKELNNNNKIQWKIVKI